MDLISWHKSSFSAYNGSCVETAFRRSSHCNGGHCVEAAGPWAKSTLSFCNSNCVETTGCRCGDVLVRDSKDPAGPRLSFSPQAWRQFTDAIKAGELALP